MFTMCACDLVKDLKVIGARIRKVRSEHETRTFCGLFWEKLESYLSTCEDDVGDQVAGLELALEYFTNHREYLDDCQEVNDLFHVIFLKCARVILSLEWQNLLEGDYGKESFIDTIKRCQPRLVQHAHSEVEVLESLIESLWSDPVLAQIMEAVDDTVLDKNQVSEYMFGQHPEVLRVRLAILYEQGCDEFALNLAQWLVKMTVFSQDPDVLEKYLVLLIKQGQRDDFHKKCSKLACHTAVELLDRVRAREGLDDIALVMAQTFLGQDLFKPVYYCCTKRLLKTWMELQHEKDEDPDTFQNSLSKMAELCKDSVQLTYFAETIHALYDDVHLNLCVSLLVKAFKADAVMLASYKHGVSDINLKSMTASLIHICNLLSSMLRRHSSFLSQVAMLTAFSLDPSEELYSFVKLLYSVIDVDKAKPLVEQNSAGTNEQVGNSNNNEPVQENNEKVDGEVIVKVEVESNVASENLVGNVSCEKKRSVDLCRTDCEFCNAGQPEKCSERESGKGHDKEKGAEKADDKSVAETNGKTVEEVVVNGKRADTLPTTEQNDVEMPEEVANSSADTIITTEDDTKTEGEKTEMMITENEAKNEDPAPPDKVAEMDVDNVANEEIVDHSDKPEESKEEVVPMPKVASFSASFEDFLRHKTETPSSEAEVSSIVSKEELQADSNNDKPIDVGTEPIPDADDAKDGDVSDCSTEVDSITNPSASGLKQYPLRKNRKRRFDTRSAVRDKRGRYEELEYSSSSDSEYEPDPEAGGGNRYDIAIPGVDTNVVNELISTLEYLRESSLDPTLSWGNLKKVCKDRILTVEKARELELIIKQEPVVKEESLAETSMKLAERPIEQLSNVIGGLLPQRAGSSMAPQVGVMTTQAGAMESHAGEMPQAMVPQAGAMTAQVGSMPPKLAGSSMAAHVPVTQLQHYVHGASSSRAPAPPVPQRLEHYISSQDVLVAGQSSATARVLPDISPRDQLFAQPLKKKKPRVPSGSRIFRSPGLAPPRPATVQSVTQKVPAFKTSYHYPTNTQVQTNGSVAPQPQTASELLSLTRQMDQPNPEQLAEGNPTYVIVKTPVNLEGQQCRVTRVNGQVYKIWQSKNKTKYNLSAGQRIIGIKPLYAKPGTELQSDTANNASEPMDNQTIEQVLRSLVDKHNPTQDKPPRPGRNTVTVKDMLESRDNQAILGQMNKTSTVATNEGTSAAPSGSSNVYEVSDSSSSVSQGQTLIAVSNTGEQLSFTVPKSAVSQVYSTLGGGKPYSYKPTGVGTVSNANYQLSYKSREQQVIKTEVQDHSEGAMQASNQNQVVMQAASNQVHQPQAPMNTQMQATSNPVRQAQAPTDVQVADLPGTVKLYNTSNEFVGTRTVNVERGEIQPLVQTNAASSPISNRVNQSSSWQPSVQVQELMNYAQQQTMQNNQATVTQSLTATLPVQTVTAVVSNPVQVQIQTPTQPAVGSVQVVTTTQSVSERTTPGMREAYAQMSQIKATPSTTRFKVNNKSKQPPQLEQQTPTNDMKKFESRVQSLNEAEKIRQQCLVQNKMTYSQESPTTQGATEKRCITAGTAQNRPNILPSRAGNTDITEAVRKSISAGMLKTGVQAVSQRVPYTVEHGNVLLGHEQGARAATGSQSQPQITARISNPTSLNSGIVIRTNAPVVSAGVANQAAAACSPRSTLLAVRHPKHVAKSRVAVRHVAPQHVSAGLQAVAHPRPSGNVMSVPVVQTGQVAILQRPPGPPAASQRLPSHVAVTGSVTGMHTQVTVTPVISGQVAVGSGQQQRMVVSGVPGHGAVNATVINQTISAPSAVPANVTPQLSQQSTATFATQAAPLAVDQFIRSAQAMVGNNSTSETASTLPSNNTVGFTGPPKPERVHKPRKPRPSSAANLAVNLQPAKPPSEKSQSLKKQLLDSFQSPPRESHRKEREPVLASLTKMSAPPHQNIVSAVPASVGSQSDVTVVSAMPSNPTTVYNQGIASTASHRSSKTVRTITSGMSPPANLSQVSGSMFVPSPGTYSTAVRTQANQVRTQASQVRTQANQARVMPAVPRSAVTHDPGT